MVGVAVVVVFGGERDVDRGQQAEDEDLHRADEAAEEHEREREADRQDPEHDRDEEVVDRDVQHQTNAERDRPDDEGRKKLDQEDEDVDRNEERPHPRSEEVLDEAEAAFFEAVVGERAEDDEPETEGDLKG